MGNAHHTTAVTSGLWVNRYTSGNVKITSLRAARNSGLRANLKDCRIPCTATENPINTKPILAMRKAWEHTSIISVVAPPCNPNRLARGFANISKTTDIRNVTSRVSSIPHFMHSFTRFLSSIVPQYYPLIRREIHPVAFLYAKLII